MKKLFSTLLVAVAALAVNACGGGAGSAAPGAGQSPEATLAAAIRADTRLPTVRAKAKQLASGSLAAGSGYPAVFIRDLNTFVSLAIEAQGPAKVREYLELFLAHQGADGNIPDGIALQDGATFKGTVESDQESSLVQAVAKYVAATGDTAFLSQTVGGIPVIARLENALDFLYTQRYAAQYGLVWGGTRADWGDVQPEDVPGVDLSDASHPSVSIYDNAMLSLALGDLQSMESAASREAGPWITKRTALRAAVRSHLWTGTQFIPHLYLDKGSPFPTSFDESRIYFQGGTGVAIQAGMLDEAEVLQAFARMVKNKSDSGSGSVGVSLYPVYPAGFFANTEYMGSEYFYQNGGDWPWFGARIVQQMVAHGQVQQAYQEFAPMLDRVVRDNGFYEWYTREGAPRGSAEYRGTAGEMAKAIDALLAWAAAH
jgi:hypothetical protein